MKAALKRLCTYSIFFLSAISLVHANSKDQISQIEKVIQKDPGNRGVSHFYTTDLFNAATSLKASKHVAILTGFFIPAAQQPETDGPLGAMFLAQSLMALGKKVTLITDSYCLSAITACQNVIQDQIDSSLFSVLLFPEESQKQLQFVSEVCSTVDCLLSIERVGRSVDGTYRTMRALDITQQTAPLDSLFLYAQSHPELEVKTIAIGDGGNEIGMGDKINQVKEHVLNGKIIACVVPSDHLIVTGVSNWGGYALAASLWALTDELEKKPLHIHQVYPSNEEQFEMLKSMIDANCCDGVLGKPVLSIDGLSWDVHEKILDEILTLIQ